MKKFCFSLCYMPKIFKRPEILNGVKIRMKKDLFMHAPVIKIRCKNKDEFMKKIIDMAEDLWNNVEKLKE